MSTFQGQTPHDLAGKGASPALANRLAAFNPDVVQLYGYRSKLPRQALLWAKRHGRPSLMVADSELLSPRTALARAVKAVSLPLILRIPSGFLTLGDENERYYAHYGVSRKRMSRSPIPIDSLLFDRFLSNRHEVRTRVREVWGVNDSDVVFLAVGKTVPRKSHDHILEAMARMSPIQRRRAVAVFAGGGPGSEDLGILSEVLKVRSVMAGFMSIPELVGAYLGADVLVHPSAADPHPLAVAEGVYTGLPVVLSDRIGSWGPTDDVRPRSNGLRYAYGNIAEFSEHLTELVRDNALRQRLGNESWQIGQTRRLTDSVASYVDAVLRVTAGQGVASG
jgi:glycosyltransferase involved in cell wall biosynthesis